jgi:hypothetical protein
MTSFYRPVPNEVFQDPTTHTCWAAALESWMSVTPQSPASWYIKTQEDAINEMKSFCDGNLGLSIKQFGFPLMAAAVGMGFEVFLRARELSGNFLYAKLKAKGYLYIFVAGGHTGLGNTLAHAGVIYGIANPWGKNCTVGVMDPWPGKGIRPMQPLADYQKAKEAVVGWLEL